MIQWQNPGVPSNTKYQRQIQEGIGFETGRDDWTDIAGTGASTTLYELQGLANGRTYGVLLRAVASSQTWCFEKLVFVTPYNPNLSKPTGLTAARVPNTSGQVRLTWNGTATDYDVQYQGRVGPSVSWTSLSTATGAIPKLSAFSRASGKTSVTVSRLPCGGWNEYDFRVREKSGTSIGPNSDVIGNIVPGRWGTAGDDTMNAPGNVGACFYGLGGNDTLRGGGGNDILAGQDGIDTLEGQAGDDDLGGGNGNDILNGGAGNDKLYGEMGNDTLNGGPGNDYLDGDEGNDHLDGGPGDDELDGGLGRNTLIGGPGADTLISMGNISDTVDYSTSTAGVKVGVYATGRGGDAEGDVLVGVMNITGSPFDDTLFGGHGNDTLRGGAGNDYLYGAGGVDTLEGQSGNDTLEGGAGGDSLDGGAGIDTASYLRSPAAGTVNFADGTHSGGDAVGDSFTSIENLSGSDFNDQLTGNDSANTLRGYRGVDTLVGNGGNDVLRGDAGNDTLSGNAGNDTLEGNEHSDTLNGGAGNDTLIGDDASMESGGLHPLWGNDVLNGNEGNDLLDGGVGDDQLLGGDGADTLIGGWGDDSLTGGAGVDTFVYLKTRGLQGTDSIKDYTFGATKAASDKIRLCSNQGTPTWSHADGGFDNFARVITVKIGQATVATIELQNSASTLSNYNAATLDIAVVSGSFCN